MQLNCTSASLRSSPTAPTRSTPTYICCCSFQSFKASCKSLQSFSFDTSHPLKHHLLSTYYAQQDYRDAALIEDHSTARDIITLTPFARDVERSLTLSLC